MTTFDQLIFRDINKAIDLFSVIGNLEDQRDIPLFLSREKTRCMQQIIGSWICVKRLTPTNIVKEQQ